MDDPRLHFPALRAHLGARDAPNADDVRRLDAARRLAKKLRYIPGISMIAVGNSVAMYASREESDIDLFIVARPGRLWLVRAIFTLFVALLGERKTARHHRDRFCLSFFADEEGLDFSAFLLEDDIYLAYWIATLKIVYDADTVYEKFLQINRDIITVKPEERDENTRWKLRATGTNREYLRWLWDMLEGIAKFFLLPRALRTHERLGKPA